MSDDYDTGSPPDLEEDFPCELVGTDKRRRKPKTQSKARVRVIRPKIKSHKPAKRK